MRNNENNLGAIIKAARISKGLTQEVLAERVDIGLRHIMSIGNEGKAPSLKVLYKLIRELHIPADLIFYPEKFMENHLLEETVCILCGCDERTLKIVRAAAIAAQASQQTD